MKKELINLALELTILGLGTMIATGVVCSIVYWVTK